MNRNLFLIYYIHEFTTIYIIYCTICPRSSYRCYKVSYHTKWVTTSWTDIIIYTQISNCNILSFIYRLGQNQSQIFIVCQEFFISYIELPYKKRQDFWDTQQDCIVGRHKLGLDICDVLGDPEVSANIYCKSRNLPNMDQHKSKVQICGNFWVTQYVDCKDRLCLCVDVLIIQKLIFFYLK